MNAHIPSSARLTNRQKKVIQEFSETAARKTQHEDVRRYLKLSISILHERFGFGHDRAAEFLGEISKASSDAAQDEVFWKHIDDIIFQELKITGWPREDYEKVDQ